MTQQEELNYKRVAKAIAFIRANFQDQPALIDIAKAVHLSPFHFQRMFTDWAGVSPKKFMQYLSLEYAKKILKEKRATLFDAAYETGLSGTGRLHDLFVNIEGMTPGEYKNGGATLKINYSLAESPFGNLIVASTAKGVCYMAFYEDESEALFGLLQQFPNARLKQLVDKLQQDALFVFQTDWKKLNEIKLHLYGTPFQLKVWETLLKIPEGNLTNYGAIAKEIGKPKASRAVGTAIGNNPVAFLIPCHRVIQASGKLGGYRWGSTRKSALIGWEAATQDEI